MATTRIYKTWVKRIESGVLTKSQCLQWAKVIVPMAKGATEDSVQTQYGYTGGRNTALTNHEARSLREIMDYVGGVNLTPEHAEQGITWIRKNPMHFPPDTAEKFVRFTFHGDAVEAHSNGFVTYWAPVWRVHLSDGNRFDYSCTPWQGPHLSRDGGQLPRVQILPADAAA